MNIHRLFQKPFFWDVDSIDPQEHAAYVIARVIDFGDFDDIAVLRRLYDDAAIAHVVRTRRSLDPKTGKYWAVRLGIPFDEVACLRKYYPPIP